MKTKAVFFGTPKIAGVTLEAVVSKLDDQIKIVGVITESDKPAGRGRTLSPPPIKVTAQKLALPIFQPETKEDIAPIIEQLKPEIGILVAYGKIIPINVIALFSLGIINIHGSLLPKYRGASPIQYAILNGDSISGATLMLLNEGVDTGDIIEKVEVDIEETDTTTTLATKIIKAGTVKLISILPEYISGKIIPKPQTSKASYAPKINKEQGLINWSQPATDILRQIRAFTPWPKSFTYFRNKQLIIHEAKIKDFKLVPMRVQLEGRSETSWQEFLNGYHMEEQKALSELLGVDQNNHS